MVLIYQSKIILNNRTANDYYCVHNPGYGFYNVTLLNTYNVEEGYNNYYKLDGHYVMNNIPLNKGILFTQTEINNKNITNLFVNCNNKISKYLILSEKLIENNNSSYNNAINNLGSSICIGMILTIGGAYIYTMLSNM